MNDSEEEGFYEPTIETVMQFVHKSDVLKTKPSNMLLKLKPALSVHYDLPLYQYPAEIDGLASAEQEDSVPPSSVDALTAILKKEGSVGLAEHFARGMECVYSKVREKGGAKRDLTLIIRNAARQARDEQVRGFDCPRSLPTQELQFSSHFESANLHLVFKDRKQDLYYLLLQNDVNTHGFNFWFFFNARATVSRKCTFLIVNLSRPVCFERQATVLAFCSHSKRCQRIGFATGLSQFCRCDNELNYWCLLFEYEFHPASDVYFSLTLPYTYSKLTTFLKTLTPVHQLTIDSVAKTPLGNAIPLIKIQRERRNCEKIILIIARQHPSETVGSFICESIIKKLASKNPLSNALLRRFRVVIIPMVNVDGVIHGNSRTNLMGYDLNRCWDRSGITQASECDQIWKYIQSLQPEGRVVWSFDLHGHSREPGFFAYFSEESEKSLILTHHLAKSTYFREKKCVYEIGASKRQSIRGQLYQRMRIKNSVTFEFSLFGYDDNQDFFHFRQAHFDEISTSILGSVLETEKLADKKMLRQGNWQEIIKQMEKSHENQKEIDSDSNPEGDYLKKQERKQFEELNQTQVERRHKSHSKESLFKVPQKRLLKTEMAERKEASQRSSPLRSSKFRLKMQEKAAAEVLRMKAPRTQLFNLTFTHRFRSDKCVIHSYEFDSYPKVTNIQFKQSQEGQELKPYPTRLESTQLENSRNQLEPEVRKSLEMRRKIKMALSNRHRTEREAPSNLIEPPTASNIKPISYPTMREREALELQTTLKSKRDTTRQLRNQSYGISLQHSRFQNSFYLKPKYP